MKLRNYLKAWSRVGELTARGGFNLVHAQWGQSALLCLPRKLPLVITYRGSDLAGIFGSNGRQTLRGRILALSSRCVSLFADHVIVVSEHLAKTLPPQVRTMSFRVEWT
jgi:hypothetical protein